MKHKYILFTLTIASSLLFTACGHKHTFADATCTTPKTCTECNEIEGEALGHTWLEATCTEPKTCSVCNEVGGEPLEHTWLEATIEAPETCDSCGLTQGEPLPEADNVDNPDEFEVDINVAIKNLDGLLARGVITEEEYNEMLEEAKMIAEAAGEDGMITDAEVIAEYEKQNPSSGTKPSSGQVEISTTVHEHDVTKKSGEGDGRNDVPFAQGDYSGLEKYSSH